MTNHDSLPAGVQYALQFCSEVTLVYLCRGGLMLQGWISLLHDLQ